MIIFTNIFNSVLIRLVLVLPDRKAGHLAIFIISLLSAIYTRFYFVSHLEHIVGISPKKIN